MEDPRQVSQKQAVPGSQDESVAQGMAVLSISCVGEALSSPASFLLNLSRVDLDSESELTCMPAILSITTLFRLYSRHDLALLSTGTGTAIKAMSD